MFSSSKQNWFTVVLFVFLIISFIFHPVKAITDSEVQDQAVTFLTKVAGLDENSLSFSSFNISRNSLLGSTIPNIGINAILSAGNQNFSLAMDIVYGKVQFYRLRWQESPKFDTIISSEDSLDFVINSLKAYETNFGAAYINELMEMLPAKLSTQDSRIENQHNVLEINYTNDSEIEPDYIKFSWSKKIDGVELQYGKLLMTMSKNGILTSFGDRTELYRIVVSDNYISEEEAVSIGRQYIDEYVEENGRTLVSVNSEFLYTVDRAARRGDSYTIYPAWWITADFSGVSKEGVFGYSVLIWADTGEAYNFGPQGIMGSLAGETTNTLYILIAVISLIVAALGIAVIYSNKRKTSQNPKTAEINQG